MSSRPGRRRPDSASEPDFRGRATLPLLEASAPGPCHDLRGEQAVSCGCAPSRRMKRSITGITRATSFSATRPTTRARLGLAAGRFVTAHFALLCDRTAALSFLRPLVDHLSDQRLERSARFSTATRRTPARVHRAGVGVAEALRAWRALDSSTNEHGAGRASSPRRPPVPLIRWTGPARTRTYKTSLTIAVLLLFTTLIRRGCPGDHHVRAGGRARKSFAAP